jgi:hypothetical protein
VRSEQTGYFASYTQTALKVRFGCNAPGTAKSSGHRRRIGSHPVWRRDAHQAILSAHRAAGFFLSAHPIRAEEQPLQHQRISGGVALSSHSWLGSDRDHRTAPLQRRLSVLGGLARVPGSEQPAALPRALRSRGAKCLSEAARPLARGEIEGRIIGGRWRFRRADLDAFFANAPRNWDFAGKNNQGD